jgi:hypothetical protein
MTDPYPREHLELRVPTDAEPPVRENRGCWIFPYLVIAFLVLASSWMGPQETAQPVSMPVSQFVSVPSPANPGAIDSGLVGAVTRQGVWAWADASYGARYLATPEKRGTRLQVCGPMDCLTLTTNDVGPTLSLQRAGRIGDLSASVFQRICGELRFGICPGSYMVLHRAPRITLPETATEIQPVR